MITPMRTGPVRNNTTIAALALALVAVSACTGTHQFGDAQPEQTAAAAPSAAPPPPQPPIDLAGKWKLSMAGGGACLMTFADTPGTAEGSIAPAGGCPGNFYTSRKWTYERDTLIIHDHKGEALVQLSFSDGRFQGQATGGGAMTLARP
jgi:Protease inhibitor Inh